MTESSLYAGERSQLSVPRDTTRRKIPLIPTRKQRQGQRGPRYIQIEIGSSPRTLSGSALAHSGKGRVPSELEFVAAERAKAQSEKVTSKGCVKCMVSVQCNGSEALSFAGSAW